MQGETSLVGDSLDEEQIIEDNRENVIRKEVTVDKWNIPISSQFHIRSDIESKVPSLHGVVSGDTLFCHPFPYT